MTDLLLLIIVGHLNVLVLYDARVGRFYKIALWLAMMVAIWLVAHGGLGS